jgi:hypothetical protein
MKISDLSNVFDPSDIEWRAQQTGVSQSGKPWLLAIPYINNRAIQQRLDDICGPENWSNEYAPAPNGNGTLCGISILVNDRWVTKHDGAENTDIEPIKGGLSNSMKRAAVQWGIGRYLYQLEAAFAVCRVVGGRRDCLDGENYAFIKPKQGLSVHCAWKAPALPLWAQPHINIDSYLEDIRTAKTTAELICAFNDAIKVAKAHQSGTSIKVITELKDSRKKSLSEQAALNVTVNLKNVEAWLEVQINGLSLIPNEAAVDSVHGIYLKELEAKCTGQHFDCDPLVKLLRDAATQAKANLQTKAA